MQKLVTHKGIPKLSDLVVNVIDWKIKKNT